MTEEKPTAGTDRDRTVLQKLFLWVLQSAHESRAELEDLTQQQGGSLQRQLLTPVRTMVFMGVVSLIASQSVAAQEGEGTDICGEGFGLMIFDIQMMAWQVILGALFLIFMLGLVLRAVPLFTGSTAVGSLMMIGPIVGVIAFIFFVQFIDIALGYAGGPGVGEGCSPFV
ncbi:hypothetical protein C491_15452 [Natronococcus amylolyticus DSM 10524]|uniref:Uncharacterized protein n=1 Tax=Natronococcus amylolyticus DSM 10524 TaxID=1227497 RepID=L9X4S8_9EURY|nr:hypothetical protein [Natronococcus amylolyticus]ELY55583.1 hypothetical protein C491_15452 [Natronococcus amylolyticus DSM 10524]